MSAYTALKPEFQQLADQGRIIVGMPNDAVYIAWGKPSEVIRGQSANGATETWRYYGTCARPYQYWDYGPFDRRNPSFVGTHGSEYENYNYPVPHLENDYYPQRYLRAEVTFQNGIVEDWLVPGAEQMTSR